MSPGSDPVLESVLRRAESLVAAARALSFALEELEGIELPPAYQPEIDQAQLRAIATLYLAAELENAGVIPAAEALARLFRSGGLSLDLGAAAPLVNAFWSQRNARPSAQERQAFFAGLFGATGGPDDGASGRNAEFEDRLIDLCESLYKMDERASNANWGGVAQQARVRSAAQALLSNLLRLSSGITVYVAQEILASMREALALLNHAALKAAFGARSVWETIDRIDRRLRRPLREHALLVRRGQSGMTILAWLAEAAPLLGGSEPLVALDHPVIPAAVDWLEASLGLSQTAPAPPPATGESTWAPLAV
jgi:hypothetical protein